jgi:hypothetical protein
MGASFEVPYIQPGPAGSVDLHWKTSERELLINVPADPAESITFYGDDYGEGVLKGAIEPGRAPVGLLLWPPKP